MKILTGIVCRFLHDPWRVHCLSSAAVHRVLIRTLVAIGIHNPVGISAICASFLRCGKAVRRTDCCKCICTLVGCSQDGFHSNNRQDTPVSRHILGRIPLKLHTFPLFERGLKIFWFVPSSLH
jgi:hypothetical protein